MDKAKELKTTSELVKSILETVPETRNSDNFLYYMICYEIHQKTLGLPFGYVLLSMKDFNLPNFETVRRSRQKIQQQFPELAGDKVKEKERKMSRFLKNLLGK